MYQDDDRPKSEFNMAVSYLNRLNNLLTFCTERAMNLDLYNWYHGLLALKRELNSQMTPAERATAEQFIRNLNQPISNHARNQEEGNDVPTELYNALHRFEEHLREVLNRSGLLTKLMDDANRALH